MKVAVLGCGTVGGGVYTLLRQTPGLEPGPVLVRPGKERLPFHVSSFAALLDDPAVEAVVEAIGGVEPAYSYAKAALSAGRHFVTANKALVAAHGPELDALARAHHVAFLFSAACGGGVPFLHNLALAAQSDRILVLGGILNGTTNFMLDRIQAQGIDYSAALAQAQALGYAEADPTADVSGLDAQRKLALACAVAYGRLPREGFALEGIESLTLADAAHFQSLGLTCRLMAKAGRTDSGALFAVVEPTLLPPGHPACCVALNGNLAYYEGSAAGTITLLGQGAGRWPTASAVLRDLTGIAQGQRHQLPEGCTVCRAENQDLHRQYYVRCSPELAAELPVAAVLREDGAVRLRTKPMPVPELHRIIGEGRKAGQSVFFAGLEETV